MVLRLDPRYPLVWRSPDTIQVGIDHPVVVLAGVTAALENVVAALRGGVPWAGALMLGRRRGASDADVAALLSALRPALEDTSVPAAAETTPATVCLDGIGPTADRIRALLGDLGFRAPAPGTDPDLAVLVGHFVLEPERHGRWLRRDIPHLPVVFSDREVHVGPLVEPGAGPCLYCLELAHADSDRAWPAMATQLLLREAPTETVRIGIDVASRVAGLVHDRLRSGRSEFTATSLAIDAATGEVRPREHRPHERCGCRSLPGTVTVPAGNAAAGRLRPSSAPDVDVPA
jgi:bacteriocin biosynthesis cyclodehydratase domain-containing protein